jgi:hypothetical protein
MSQKYYHLRGSAKAKPGLSAKAGDIIIIPPNTPHAWVNIPDHVDYLSFRPSPGILTAGFVRAAIKK